MPPSRPATMTNRLLKQSYSRLGRNLLFEARPAVVHFGGYTVHQPHSQMVQVINISRSSQRLHILGPTSEQFKVRCNKKGLVAPGSSEVIMVDFHPLEQRYHYDCIRLHTDGENMLVPLHAYPVMNDVVFPEHISFGEHALGEVSTHTVEMVCKVPIQFEFEISITSPHPHFRVSPMRGIVPVNGFVKVTIEYTPTSSISAEMRLLVNVSQFNFKPVSCVVTGKGRTGIVRRKEMQAGVERLGMSLDDSLTEFFPPPSGERGIIHLQISRIKHKSSSSDGNRSGGIDCRLKASFLLNVISRLFHGCKCGLLLQLCQQHLGESNALNSKHKHRADRGHCYSLSSSPNRPTLAAFLFFFFSFSFLFLFFFFFFWGGGHPPTTSWTHELQENSKEITGSMIRAKGQEQCLMQEEHGLMSVRKRRGERRTMRNGCHLQEWKSLAPDQRNKNLRVWWKAW
ncbi:unnamed protein product [Choristocarpus tenellus]